MYSSQVYISTTCKLYLKSVENILDINNKIIRSRFRYRFRYVVPKTCECMYCFRNGRISLSLCCSHTGSIAWTRTKISRFRVGSPTH